MHLMLQYPGIPQPPQPQNDGICGAQKNFQQCSALFATSSLSKFKIYYTAKNKLFPDNSSKYFQDFSSLPDK